MINRKCTKCLAVLPIEDFRKRIKGKYGRDSVCRICRRPGDRLWQEGVRRKKRDARLAARVNPFFGVPQATLAYMAGIVDGEGSIGLFRSKRRGAAAQDYYVARVSVANTSDALMRFVVAALAKGKVRLKKRSAISNKDCYQWTVTSRTASSLSEVLLPFLVIKKRQAEIVVELDTMIRLREGLRLSSQAAALRRRLYEECMVLNGRRVR